MPTRSCIICKKKNDKDKLFRIVCLKDSKMLLDKSQKENARGIYLCRDIECVLKLEKNIKKQKFNFKKSVDNDKLYEILEEIKRELGE